MKGYSRTERNLNDAQGSRGNQGSRADRRRVCDLERCDGRGGRAAHLGAAGERVDAAQGIRRAALGGGGDHRATTAIAVAVSQSSGTVRLFQNGEVVLRIEPFRRPMKWKDFEQEPDAD